MHFKNLYARTQTGETVLVNQKPEEKFHRNLQKDHGDLTCRGEKLSPEPGLLALTAGIT